MSTNVKTDKQMQMVKPDCREADPEEPDWRTVCCPNQDGGGGRASPLLPRSKNSLHRKGQKACPQTQLSLPTKRAGDGLPSPQDHHVSHASKKRSQAILPEDPFPWYPHPPFSGILGKVTRRNKLIQETVMTTGLPSRGLQVSSSF